MTHMTMKYVLFKIIKMQTNVAIFLRRKVVIVSFLAVNFHVYLIFVYYRVY